MDTIATLVSPGALTLTLSQRERGQDKHKAERSDGPTSIAMPSAAKARPTPSGCAEERSVSRIRARSCLSEASSARPRETRAPQVARSEAEGRRQWVAFSLVTFFWRSKRK